MKDYFIAETRSKYIAAFDYVDKTLLVLLATNGGVSIALFDIAKCESQFCRRFFNNGIAKELLKTMRKKKRKPIRLFYKKEVS